MTSSHGHGRGLKLRLYLEGIEVPVISAQVQAAIGGPAAAQIQIIPTDAAMRLLPRTLVHMFYRDMDSDVLGFSEADGGTNETPKWRLMFSGELVAIQFSKQPGSRSAILQCMDTSGHWDTTYQFQLSYGGNASNIITESSKFFGAGNTFLSDVVLGATSPSAVIAQMFSPEPTSPKSLGLEDLTGIHAGVIKLMEAMGGVPTKTWGVNDYASISELRLKNLMQLFTDKGESLVLDQTIFQQMLTSGLAQLGDMVSTRDMLSLAADYLYYQICPNPVAKYELGSALPSKLPPSNSTLYWPVVIDAEIRGTFEESRGDHQHKALDLAIPIGTPVFPIAGGIVTTARVGVGEEKAGTQVQIDHLNGFVSKYFHLDSLAVSLGEEVVGTDLPIGYSGDTGSAKGHPHLHLELWLDGVAVDPQAHILNHIWIGNIEEAPSPKETEEPVSWDPVSTAYQLNSSQADKRKYAKLYTQVFRPDVWFVPPPRCNVFFPEHYTSFTFSRFFLNETTRLMLSVGDAITNTQPTGFTAFRYYAPSNDQMRKLLGSGGGGILDKALPVMRQERFSGIVPKIEQLQAVSLYAGKVVWEAALTRGIAQNPSMDRFAQNTANYNFLRYRFGARSMSITGTFNPYPVIGFPALVIDRGWAAHGVSVQQAIEKVGSGDTVDGLPTQYLGMITSLSHSLSQEGGMTSAAFSHARTHQQNEFDDEYVKITVGEEAVITEGESSAVLRADDDRDSLILWTLINRVVEASPALELVLSGGAPISEEEQILLNTAFGGLVGASIAVSDRISTSWKEGTGTITALEVGATVRLIPVVGYRYLLPETLSISVRYQILGEGKKKLASGLAMEEALYPAWFSEQYYPANITKDIYIPAFGVGAITEDQTIKLGGEVSLTETAELVEDPLQPIPVDRPEGQTVNKPVSIGQAVDALSIIYGQVKSSHADASKFVQRYTSRPVATLEEVLGGEGFSIDQGTGNITNADQEGFHSRAFGPLVDLVGLLDNPDIELARVGGTVTEKIDKTLDPRKDRQDRVAVYVFELHHRRGFPG